MTVSITPEEIARLRARAEKAEAELAAWRSGNPSDDLWRVRMEQAEARAEAAEKACAAMRAVAKPAHVIMPVGNDTPLGADFVVLPKEALSTDAGKGYVSPEVAEQMAAALRLAKEKAEQVLGGQVNPTRRLEAVIEVATAALAAYEKARGGA